MMLLSSDTQELSWLSFTQHISSARIEFAFGTGRCVFKLITCLYWIDKAASWSATPVIWSTTGTQQWNYTSNNNRDSVINLEVPVAEHANTFKNVILFGLMRRHELSLTTHVCLRLVDWQSSERQAQLGMLQLVMEWQISPARFDQVRQQGLWNSLNYFSDSVSHLCTVSVSPFMT